MHLWERSLLTIVYIRFCSAHKDTFKVFDNDITGPFTCPEFIESCAVSCNNGTEEKCRVLK